MAQHTSDWLMQLAHLSDQMGRRLFSYHDLLCNLQTLFSQQQCPFEKIRLGFTRRAPFANKELVIGGSPASPASQATERPHVTDSIYSLDAHGVECRIELWRKNSSDAGNAGQPFADLIKAFWKGSLRDDKSWLVSFQHSETYLLIDEVVRFLLSESEGPSPERGDAKS